MEKTLKNEGWMLLSHEGEVIGAGLLTREAVVRAMLMDDEHDYEIQRGEDGTWWLWLSSDSRNRAGGNRGLRCSTVFSLADDESTAEAEIFEKVASMAGEWHGPYGGYRIVTAAERAAELAEDDEDEAWFAFYPFGRRGDAYFGWGTHAEAERYQAVENRGRDIDTDDWVLMDRVAEDEVEDFDGFNISDFFAGNPEAGAA